VHFATSRLLPPRQTAREQVLARPWVYSHVEEQKEPPTPTTKGRLAEYNVALVGEDRERRVAAGRTPGAIGDELDVDGIRCQVIAHLWREGEPETLLCRRLATAPEDKPVIRERGWWLPGWH
jgi:hypothetical protein